MVKNQFCILSREKLILPRPAISSIPVRMMSRILNMLFLLAICQDFKRKRYLPQLLFIFSRQWCFSLVCLFDRQIVYVVADAKVEVRVNLVAAGNFQWFIHHAVHSQSFHFIRSKNQNNL